MTKPKFTLGADPEMFFKGADGQPISAHDLVPGSKKEPHKVDKGAVQPDGLAAEFNVDAVPYNDFRSFEENLTSVMMQLRSYLPKGASFDRRASVVFDKAYYESLPESAKELGCDPDYCAYSDDPFQPNPRPEGASGLRGAGGHIHVGWGSDIPADHPDHMEICRKLIRNMDVYVGLAMLIFDKDTERRKVYGKAGAFRPKSYGCEYRTPSNAWIIAENRRRFIHSQTVACLEYLSTGKDRAAELSEPKYVKTFGSVQDIINNGDSANAEAILTKVLGTYVNPALKEG